MFKNKLLLAATLVAPLFTMTSCNQGTISVTLDTGVGYFNDFECYRTMTIAKGSSLSAVLGEDVPTYEGEDTPMCPIYWIQDDKTIIHWNDSINTSTTLHAHYYSSIQDAKYISLAKIETSYMAACYKNPEKINFFKPIYKAAAEHVANATTEGTAIGMGKVGSSEIDGCAKQPDAISPITSVAEYYFTALEKTEEVLSNSLALGVATVGGGSMDACSRQPGAIDMEGKKGLRDAALVFLDAVKTLPSYDGVGFGKFGSSFMDVCGRQPDTIGQILEKTPTIFDGFSKAKNGLQAVAIGKAASSWADACGRQPQYIDTFFEELVKNINDILNS